MLKMVPKMMSALNMAVKSTTPPKVIHISRLSEVESSRKSKKLRLRENGVPLSEKTKKQICIKKFPITLTTLQNCTIVYGQVFYKQVKVDRIHVEGSTDDQADSTNGD